jgi:hypothetical protein
MKRAAKAMRKEGQVVVSDEHMLSIKISTNATSFSTPTASGGGSGHATSDGPRPSAPGSGRTGTRLPSAECSTSR